MLSDLHLLPSSWSENILGIASYSIMLGDSITSRLAAKWSKVRTRAFWYDARLMIQFEGYEVAMVDGQIAFSGLDPFVSFLRRSCWFL
jgi:hypothetical protein